MQTIFASPISNDPATDSAAPLLAKPPHRHRISSTVVLFLMAATLFVVVAVLKPAPNPTQMVPGSDPGRGVPEGVSPKSNGLMMGAPSFSWTNRLLGWQRTAFHFQPKKNWMNGQFLFFFSFFYHFL